ncbi:beta-taxilin-like isoform X2 [Daphnia pulicaria]|uniref:beta-taxilin-like isoform X2 n=1 Tax=Daphnia pulicaria TaxID=35523 RepID=UPI001EEAFAC9|nr:beta-taxilin-like isoform X2 [Daphnia pulicaria]
MNFQLQSLMQQISINDKTCSEENEGESQHSSYFSSPLPTWSSTPLHNQQKAEQVSSDSPNSSMEKEQFTPKKRILTQFKLAPEEFSLEDVQHMQKLIKELHAENVQKTMSCIKLEQTCHSLKDEIAYLKQKDHKQNLEDSEIYRMEISKSPATVTKEEKLVMELNDCKLRCDAIQREEFRLRELVSVYEERFEYFLKIVTNTTTIFAENKRILDATMMKIQVLESEIATWKERENNESEKKKMLHSLVEEMFCASSPNSLR